MFFIIFFYYYYYLVVWAFVNKERYNEDDAYKHSRQIVGLVSNMIPVKTNVICLMQSYML